MNESVTARSTMETGLREGLVNDQFLLHYDPLVACASGAVAGFEAQLFWRHPRRGLLPASAFIAESEDPSVVLPLTQWLVQSACIQLRAWSAMGRPALNVMLNVHPATAERGTLAPLVREAIAQAGIDGSLLMLALSRDGATRDHARVRATLDELHAMGVRIVLDGLRVGGDHQGLSGGYPGGMVRVERTALGAHGSTGVPAVGRAVATLARTLDLGIVLSGVDTTEQLAFARAAGCDLAQGAEFGGPVPAEGVTQLLARLGKSGLAQASGREWPLQ